MQEFKIQDQDGVTRCYGFDAFDGKLYVRPEGLNPGRPYRPVHHTKKPDCFGIRTSHAEFWADAAKATKTLAEAPAPDAFWRGAY